MSHDAWIEQADVYALGALDKEELAQFEGHLATGCRTCAERIRETREALTLLPRSLPTVAPPSALRARVLAEIAAERPAQGTPVPLRPERRRGRALWWAGWAGLAAAAALLLVVNAELSKTRQEVRALEGRLATLQTELAQREETLRFLSDRNVRYVSLAGLKPTPEASAWLLWNSATRQGLLLARGLPAAAGGAHLRALGARGNSARARRRVRRGPRRPRVASPPAASRGSNLRRVRGHPGAGPRGAGADRPHAPPRKGAVGDRRQSSHAERRPKARLRGTSRPGRANPSNRVRERGLTPIEPRRVR